MVYTGLCVLPFIVHPVGVSQVPSAWHVIAAGVPESSEYPVAQATVALAPSKVDEGAVSTT